MTAVLEYDVLPVGQHDVVATALGGDPGLEYSVDALDEDAGLPPSLSAMPELFEDGACPPQLGRGISRPLVRASGDLVHTCGESLVRSCLGQVFGTRCRDEQREGELLWRTEFGSLLPVLRHRNVDHVTEALARYYSAGAVARWEPRVRVKSAKVVTRWVSTDRGRTRVTYVEIGYSQAGVPAAGSVTLRLARG